MEVMGLLESFKYYLPEVYLIGTILVAVLTEVFSTEKIKVQATTLVALSGLLLSLFSIFSHLSVFHDSGPIPLFFGAILYDNLSAFIRFLIYLSGLLVMGCLYWSKETSDNLKSEQIILTLIVLLGSSLMVAAEDLLSIYVGMETVSILSYALVGFNKGNKKSSEGATKYVVYGAVSSGVMLFGMSLIYGMAKSLDLNTIGTFLTSSLGHSEAAYFCLFLILVGFLFKLSAFPMWMWTPDVYTGAPTPIAALLSIVPKAAAFGLLIRISGQVLSLNVNGNLEILPSMNWPAVFTVVAACTMSVGNLGAIGQSSAKRLLGYSSIAQAGYLFIGFAVGTIEGFQATLFYLFVYLFMNLGIFSVISHLVSKTGTDEIEDFKGLAWKEPFLCIMAAIFLFSLVGLPPFGGFVGKFYLFSAAVKKELYALVIIGVLNSVVSLFYYLKIIKTMFLSKPNEHVFSLGLTSIQKGLIFAFAIPTLLLGIYWPPVMKLVEKATHFLN